MKINLIEDEVRVIAIKGIDLLKKQLLTDLRNNNLVLFELDKYKEEYSKLLKLEEKFEKPLEICRLMRDSRDYQNQLGKCGDKYTEVEKRNMLKILLQRKKQIKKLLKEVEQ